MVKLFLKKINPLLGKHASFPLSCFLPVYHCVSDDDLPHIRHIISYKTTREFESDLDYMMRNFEFTDWDFFKNNYQKPNRKPYALLTFDDGLYEFRDVVMPILLRKGIYAVNFINPAFTDNSDMMFRLKTSLIIDKLSDPACSVPASVIRYLHLKGAGKNEAIRKLKAISYENTHQLERVAQLIGLDFQDYRKKRKIYMDTEDLQDVKAQGFGIASHSWDHPYFASLPVQAQLANIRQSMEYIRKNAFLDECFAFPFTDFGIKKELFEQLFAENENLRLTFGTAGIKRDSFTRNLQRIPMENGCSAKHETEFENNYYQLKKLINKNTIQR